MKNNELRKIEERLVPPPTPDPPEGLLGRIREEIPEHLGEAEEAPDGTARSPWRLRLVAASLLIAATGGVISYQVWRQSPPVSEWASKSDEKADTVVVETPEPETAIEAFTAAPAEEQERLAIEVGSLDDQIAGQQLDLRAGGEAPKDKVAPTPDGARATDELMAQGEGASRRLNEVVGVSEPGRGERDEGRAQLSQSVTESLEKKAPAPARQAPGTRDHGNARAEAVPHRVETPPAPRSRAGRYDYPGGEKGEDAGVITGGSRMEGTLSEAQKAHPSTGGTTEPNDQPFGDMFFRHYGVNPFVDTEDDRFSTFGLDVDTGSYTMARSYLDRGHLPPPDAIRVEEFVNYFDYDDPAPRKGEFTITAEGAPSPFAQGQRYYLVRFGIKGREIDPRQRQPALLTFVVDVSGSMNRENRLELVKRSLELLLDELEREDRVGLVVYGNRGEVLLEPTSDKEAIRRAIWRLQPGGSTNAEEGLRLAYDLARRYRRRGAINRVILCSDGVANVGHTTAESILERVRRAADEGIELNTVGFGMGNYNDVLMEQLADQGDGHYAYVDTLEESRRIFVEELAGTLQTIATDAKVQVEFNPDTVSRYRLLGYENRDIADERFRDDTVDAGEIGAGHTVTALYEIKLQESVGRREGLATLRLRYRSKATGRVSESEVEFRSSHIASSWKRGSAALRLSSLAAELAEVLRGSYWAKDADLDDLYRRVRRLADDEGYDDEIEELIDMVRRVRDLTPPLWQGEDYEEDQ